MPLIIVCSINGHSNILSRPAKKDNYYNHGIGQNWSIRGYRGDGEVQSQTQAKGCTHIDLSVYELHSVVPDVMFTDFSQSWLRV